MRTRVLTSYERDLTIPFALYDSPEIVGRSHIRFDNFLEFIYLQQRYLKEQHSVEKGHREYVNPLPPAAALTATMNGTGAGPIGRSAHRSSSSGAFANANTARAGAGGSIITGDEAAAVAEKVAQLRRSRASIVSFSANSTMLSDTGRGHYYNNYMLGGMGTATGGGGGGGSDISDNHIVRVPLLSGQLWESLAVACRPTGAAATATSADVSHARYYSIDVRVSRNVKKKNQKLFEQGDVHNKDTLNDEMTEKARTRFCHYLFSFNPLASAPVDNSSRGNFYSSPVTADAPTAAGAANGGHTQHATANSTLAGTTTAAAAFDYNVHEYLLYGMREVAPWSTQYLELLQECVSAADRGSGVGKIPEYIRVLLQSAVLVPRAQEDAAGDGADTRFKVERYTFNPLTIPSPDYVLDAIVPPRLLVYFEVDPYEASRTFHQKRKIEKRIAHLRSDIVNRQYQRWRQRTGKVSAKTDDGAAGEGKDDATGNTFRVTVYDRATLQRTPGGGASSDTHNNNNATTISNNKKDDSNGNSPAEHNLGGTDPGKDRAGSSHKKKKAAAAANEEEEEANDDKHLWLELYQLEDDLEALESAIVGETVVMVERASRTQSARRELIALEESVNECLELTGARCVGVPLSQHLHAKAKNGGQAPAPLAPAGGGATMNKTLNRTLGADGGNGAATASATATSGDAGVGGGRGRADERGVVALTTKPGARPHAKEADKGGTASALPTLNVLEPNEERYTLLCLLLQDELVRQVALDSTERGVLLRKILSEALLSVTSWRTLYEDSVGYGGARVREGQRRRAEMQAQETALEAEVAGLKERLAALRQRGEKLKEWAAQRTAADAKKRETEKKFQDSVLVRLQSYAEQLKAFQDQERLGGGGGGSNNAATAPAAAASV